MSQWARLRGRQPLRAALTGSQAGDEIGNIAADFFADDPGALDAHGLSRARPIQVLDHLRPLRPRRSSISRNASQSERTIVSPSCLPQR